MAQRPALGGSGSDQLHLQGGVGAGRRGEGRGWRSREASGRTRGVRDCGEAERRLEY